MSYRLTPLLVLVAALAAACGTSTPAPVPTAPPSLNTSLWVDYPAVPVACQQAANITVNDPSGRPVPGATAIGIIESQGFNETLNFPVTDAEGRARVSLALPTVASLQTFTITVRVVDSHGRWDEAITTFEAYP